MQRHNYYKSNTDTYKNLSINNHNNLITARLESCYWIIQNCIHNQTRTAQQHFTLKLPSTYLSNEDNDAQLFKAFIKALKKRWNNAKRGKLHYAWCKEVERCKGAHWHLHLFSDQNKNNPLSIPSLVEKAWEKALTAPIYYKGLVNYTHFRTLYRDKTESIHHAMKWVSYICKVREGTYNHGFAASHTDKNIDLECIA